MLDWVKLRPHRRRTRTLIEARLQVQVPVVHRLVRRIDRQLPVFEHEARLAPVLVVRDTVLPELAFQIVLVETAQEGDLRQELEWLILLLVALDLVPFFLFFESVIFIQLATLVRVILQLVKHPSVLVCLREELSRRLLAGVVVP